MTDANWAFIIVLFACVLAAAAFYRWVYSADHQRRVRDDQHAADDQPGLITFDAPTLAEAFGWLDEKTETWLFPSDEFIEGDFYDWEIELREGA